MFRVIYAQLVLSLLLTVLFLVTALHFEVLKLRSSYCLLVPTDSAKVSEYPVTVRDCLGLLPYHCSSHYQWSLQQQPPELTAAVTKYLWSLLQQPPELEPLLVGKLQNMLLEDHLFLLVIQ